MSTLCEVTVIDRVEKHPDADSLDIVYFGEFKTISRLGSFKPGDYGIYLATASVLPDSMLQAMGMWDDVAGCGTLAGNKGNRIKPKKLRGIVSEGIMHGPFTLSDVQTLTGLEEPVGAEVKDLLGVTKFDPNQFDKNTGKRLGGGDPRSCFTAHGPDVHVYDIENIKKHRARLEEYFEKTQSLCVVTEKIHGTNFPVRLIDNASRPEDLQYAPELCPDNVLVSSKGRLEKGNWIKPDGADKDSVYWAVARVLALPNRLAGARQFYGADLTLVGEIYGVQDLSYGSKTVGDIKDFAYKVDELPINLPYAIFDVFVGDRFTGRYLNDAELDVFCSKYNIKRVPVLYRGKFDYDLIRELTDGKETISGNNLHIREGVVVRDVEEGGNCRGLARVQVKSISDDYLLRGGGTEFT